MQVKTEKKFTPMATNFREWLQPRRARSKEQALEFEAQCKFLTYASTLFFFNYTLIYENVSMYYI